MSDIQKLVSYLRRFECRDRDGNYWSPQEIIEAADRLEQLEAENERLQRNYDSCKPYRRMSDRIVEACIESRTYDELYNRCMDALDEAEPGTRTAIEVEHVRKIMKGGDQ